MVEKKYKAVIFLDFKNIECAFGQFYISRLDEMFKYVISQINEEINLTKVVIVGFFEEEKYISLEMIKNKYNLEIISTKPNSEIFDPDDRIIRELILKYSNIKSIKKIVIVSLDGGYFQNLKIANEKGKDVYIAANNRKNKKYSIFKFIDLDTIKTKYLFENINEDIYKTTININLIYSEKNTQEAIDYISKLEKLHKDFKQKSDIHNTFIKKIKKEPYI